MLIILGLINDNVGDSELSLHTAASLMSPGSAAAGPSPLPVGPPDFGTTIKYLC